MRRFILLCISIGFLIAVEKSSYREFYDGADALNWGNTILAGSIFSPEEQNIIFDYSKGSSIFNNKLRAGEKLENLPPEEQNKIRALDSALNKMIAFENIKSIVMKKFSF